MELLVTVLTIFFLRLIDVVLMTTVTLSMVSNKKLRAAIVGFIEAMLYVLILGKVMAQLTNVYTLLAYGGAYGLGILLTMVVEDRLKDNNFNAQIVTNASNEYIIDEIRDMGMAVTVLKGEGIDKEERLLLFIVLKRKKRALLDQYAKDKKLFMTVNESTPINGYFR